MSITLDTIIKFLNSNLENLKLYENSLIVINKKGNSLSCN